MKYFEIKEFDSPDSPGSGKKMNQEFLKKIDSAREEAGIPFHINSGFRTKKHNELVGGRVGSSHLIGVACDIGYRGSRERFLILKSLMKVGFNRFGLGKSFIHVDGDIRKDENVIWTY